MKKLFDYYFKRPTSLELEMDRTNNAIFFLIALTIGVGASKYLDFVYMLGILMFTLPAI